MTKPIRKPRVIRSVLLSSEQREADEWVKQLDRERLPRLREVAQQWGTAVSAVTGLIGAGSIVNADSAVRSLRGGWGLLYGVFAAAALLAAVVSILLAGAAARSQLVKLPVDVNAQIKLREQLVDLVVKRLFWSRAFFGLSILLLIIAFGIRWYAPQQPKKLAQSGKAACRMVDASRHYVDGKPIEAMPRVCGAGRLEILQ
jgi:hypothetical protein